MVKTKPKSNIELEKSNEVFTPAEIKKYCKIISDIGTKKKEGFIIIGESKKGKEKYYTDGVVLIHKMSKQRIMQSVMNVLEVDARMVLLDSLLSE